MMKILILEQDEITKFLNDRFLGKSFHLLQSSTVQDFCSMLEKELPDMIIIEMNFLGRYMFGLEVLEKVRPLIQNSVCITVAATFASRPSDRERILKKFDFLTEHPLTVDSLNNLIHKVPENPVDYSATLKQK
jgi:two-component SAPR family response regulator